MDYREENPCSCGSPAYYVIVIRNGPAAINLICATMKLVIMAGFHSS